MLWIPEKTIGGAIFWTMSATFWSGPRPQNVLLYSSQHLVPKMKNPWVPKSFWQLLYESHVFVSKCKWSKPSVCSHFLLKLTINQLDRVAGLQQIWYVLSIFAATPILGIEFLDLSAISFPVFIESNSIKYRNHFIQFNHLKFWRRNQQITWRGYMCAPCHFDTSCATVTAFRLHWS